jgi:hypothetical protein
MTDARNASVSATLRAPFQHHPSNDAPATRRDPQKSAIPLRAPDPAELEADRPQVERLDDAGRADRAAAAGRNAKSFAGPRPPNGAGTHFAACGLQGAAISDRQNIRQAR